MKKLSFIYMYLVLLIVSNRFTDLDPSNISLSKLSPGSESYDSIAAYNQSKLCMLLLAMELHRKLAKSAVSCFSVHPGNMVRTGISRHWWVWRILFALVSPFAKSPVSEIKSFKNYHYVFWRLS